MKATIKSTTKIVRVQGFAGPVEARIWEGVTENGVHFHAYVTRVAVAENENAEQFDAELRECKPPTAEIEALPDSIRLN